MYKKDYIVRLTEEFGKFLGLMMSLRLNNNYRELEKLIADCVQKFTGQEIEWVESLSDEKFIENINTIETLSREQLKILADLLYEKGVLYLDENHIEKSTNCLSKALLIFLHLKETALDSDFSLDTHYKIANIYKLNSSVNK